jgi:hypothetical protein
MGCQPESLAKPARRRSHKATQPAAAYAPRELDDHSFAPEDIASMSAAFEAAAVRGDRSRPHTALASARPPAQGRQGFRSTAAKGREETTSRLHPVIGRKVQGRVVVEVLERTGRLVLLMFSPCVLRSLRWTKIWPLNHGTAGDQAFGRSETPGSAWLRCDGSRRARWKHRSRNGPPVTHLQGERTLRDAAWSFRSAIARWRAPPETPGPAASFASARRRRRHSAVRVTRA